MTDSEIADAMYDMGGSFSRALAEAWRCGDKINRGRLAAAFPDLWEHYRELAELREQRRVKR
jgi:hypothetical protein